MTFAFSVNKDWFQIHENLQERLCLALQRFIRNARGEGSFQRGARKVAVPGKFPSIADRPSLSSDASAGNE